MMLSCQNRRLCCVWYVAPLPPACCPARAADCAPVQLQAARQAGQSGPRARVVAVSAPILICVGWLWGWGRQNLRRQACLAGAAQCQVSAKGWATCICPRGDTSIRPTVHGCVWACKLCAEDVVAACACCSPGGPSLGHAPCLLAQCQAFTVTDHYIHNCRGTKAPLDSLPCLCCPLRS